jgi:hypothetical protein
MIIFPSPFSILEIVTFWSPAAFPARKRARRDVRVHVVRGRRPAEKAVSGRRDAARPDA